MRRLRFIVLSPKACGCCLSWDSTKSADTLVLQPCCLNGRRHSCCRGSPVPFLYNRTGIDRSMPTAHSCCR